MLNIRISYREYLTIILIVTLEESIVQRVVECSLLLLLVKLLAYSDK